LRTSGTKVTPKPFIPRLCLIGLAERFGADFEKGVMQLYRKIVGRMEQQIADGVYGLGDRIPSVRQASQSLGVSMTTINHAYGILEEMGLIRARPQSGYIVIRTAPTGAPPAMDGGSKVAAPLPNDLEGIALEVMGAVRHPRKIPFGAASPDIQLFPLARLLV
jgi:DNA-binding transcriptional MocR family regulator